MFKFDFEVDQDPVDEGVGPAAPPLIQLESFSELSIAHLLEALPSQLSYSPVSIPLASTRQRVTLARRDLFDARFQLISVGTGADGDNKTEETSSGSSALAFLDAPSDLIPGVYEGGLKTWECSLDLVNYLDGVAGPSAYFQGKAVLEVGCGTAIPSTYIVSRLFSEEPPMVETRIHLQDYNTDVIELITFPNIILAWYMSPASDEYRSSITDNEDDRLPPAEVVSPGELSMTADLKKAFSASLERYKIRLQLFSGPWQSLAAHIPPTQAFDIVLTSETIYRLEALPALIQLLEVASGEQAICLVAAKVLYFGVGGGVAEFVAALDPALELGGDGPQQRLAAGKGPMSPAQMQEILQDPAKLSLLLSMMPRDNPETGETAIEQMMREKREWAEADAKSAKLKEQGNDAFRAGDYKKAFAVYTACMLLSAHEPLYPLNRAAVGLKLQLYQTVVEDASEAVERDFNSAKAHFRRGQAFYFLGEWSKAEDDYAKALKLQPNDSAVMQQKGELKRVRGLSAAEQAAWLAGQTRLTLRDVFPKAEFKARIEEALGRKMTTTELGMNG
ncbi:hypothetical protein MIND_00112200 [Mycena indigotica]|uniref:Uncharacterized protein n=1 Tax=Mycena indigotica TaxID=2126181 RepID=A0A8H6WKP7_9AGAR|nr:uncharacterized protein MIND_00112200 [Mycena indigotica]KAF7315954.1 hypothetical protein MIND_00112200 [Mycena indigotica]